MDPMRRTTISRLWAFTIVILSTTAVRGNNIKNGMWKENITEENFIYNDGVVFTQQTSSAIGCARACNMHSMDCLDFSYTEMTEECRGYDGLSHDSVSQADTRMWNGVCRLDGYTYDPTFRVCIRLYNIERTWNESLEACSNDTAYLLVLDTMEKLQATRIGVHKDSFAASKEWWLGGYDYDDGPTNDFKWSNGERVDAPSDIWFHPNEPSDESERCINLFLYYPSAFGLNDRFCNVTMFYACQEEI